MKNAMIELNASMESLRHAISNARVSFNILMHDDTVPLAVRVKAFSEFADEILPMGDWASDSPFNTTRMAYTHELSGRGDVIYLTDVLEQVLEYANERMDIPSKWITMSCEEVLNDIEANWPEIKGLVEENIHSEVYAYRIDW